MCRVVIERGRFRAAWAALYDADSGLLSATVQQKDPEPTHWDSIAIAHGARGCAAVPIRRGGKVIGVLKLVASEKAFFDAPMRELLRISRHRGSWFDAPAVEQDQRQSGAATP